MKTPISRTANILWVIVALFSLNLTNAFAGDVVEFNYFFSDQFFSGENPLGKEIDPDLAKAKEAVITACKAWETATNGRIKFSPAGSRQAADIIFKGWSKKGPGVSIQDNMLCLDDDDIGNLFSEYMPKALSFTLFEDCNAECHYPQFWDPADADNDHRAEIFFHIQDKTDKGSPWYYILDKDKLQFEEAQRDIVRLVMQEIGHALGFCGYPDENAEECSKIPPCSSNKASIMCKNRVRCLQEGPDGLVPVGGMDDIRHPGIRDLTLFDKIRVLKKYFPGRKVLYGSVQDARGNPIPKAVVSTEDEKFTAVTNKNGVYSLWRILPGTYFIKVHNPGNEQDISEIIAVSPVAPDIIIKNFKFTEETLMVAESSRVIPSMGGPADIYTFEATFKGISDESPDSAKLLVDGKTISDVSFQSTPKKPAYGFSYYGLPGIKPGAHYYEFKVVEQGGDRQHTLNGSFKVNRLFNIRLSVESRPSTVMVGKNKHVKVIAQLRDKKGSPPAGKAVRFQTNFPGFFTPAGGKALTNTEGLAEILFTPATSGKAMITAIPPRGPSAMTVISCKSRPISIEFECRPAGNNVYKVISRIKYFEDKKPAADEAVKWRLQPSETCTWAKSPDQKTDGNGNAHSTFTLGATESTRVTVTITHVATGISGTGTFILGGDKGVRIPPKKKLVRATEPCEWSSNGYFAVRQRNGSGLSIYRVSDWAKVWSKKRRSGKYHSFSFAPNGRKFAASVFTGKDEVAVINVPSGNVDNVWDATVDGESKTSDRSFVWKGNDIYAIQNDNVILKWSESGNLEMRFTNNAEIEEFRFNPSVDSQFASVDRDGELKIWDKNSGKPVKTVRVESISTGKLKCLAWSHDGKKLVVGSSSGDTGTIYLFDTSSWSKSGFDLPGLGYVNSLDYNNDSSRLAIGHDKGLLVIDTKTYKIKYYNTGSVTHVRWSPDGTMLAAGGQIYGFNDSNLKAPVIQVLTPQSGASFAGISAEIMGKIFGSQTIRSARVSVNGGKPAALSLKRDSSFTKKVMLADGRNRIRIQVEDSIKNVTSFSMTVDRMADSIPPTLADPYVASAMGEKGTKFNLSVRALDSDSGVDTSKVTAGIRLPAGHTAATVKLYDDGKHGDGKPGDGLFGNWWNSIAAGERLNFVDFFAVDWAGNSSTLHSRLKIFVYDRPAIKKPYLSTNIPLSKEAVHVNADITDMSGVQSADLLYSKDAGHSWNRVPMSHAGTTYIGTIPPQSPGTVYYKVKALDIHGYESETGSYAYTVRDDAGPVVTIQQPATTETSFTTEPFIIVSGRAMAAGGPGLKSVTCSTGAVNNGTLEEWSFNVHLNKGINPVTIVAESQDGKLASDSIDVTYSPKLAAPVFSPKAPYVFTAPVTVALIVSSKGATIHYTMDNTDPTEASPVYTSPFLLGETTTIKARAYMPGWTPSDTSEGTYALKQQKKVNLVKAASSPEEKSVIKSESVLPAKIKSIEKSEPSVNKETAGSEKQSESIVNLAVQLAAFKDGRFAEELVRKLQKKGFPAYSVTGKSLGKTTWYKVRIGPFNNKKEVENTLDRLKKYKKKAIIIVDQTKVPPPLAKAESVSSKASSTLEKQKVTKAGEKQISAIKLKKNAPKEKAAVKKMVIASGKGVSVSESEAEKEKALQTRVKESTPLTKAGEKGELLVVKPEIPEGKNRKERLKLFLDTYCRTYESKDLDRFVAFFTYDATENNRPFYEMLPKYRKNMEMIESFSYQIEMASYTVQLGTGNIKLQGKYLTKYVLHDGTRDEKSGNISMELVEDGDSFLVKRLNYGESSS